MVIRLATPASGADDGCPNRIAIDRGGPVLEVSPPKAGGWSCPTDNNGRKCGKARRSGGSLFSDSCAAALLDLSPCGYPARSVPRQKAFDFGDLFRCALQP
jgi:hypothetical protein